MLELQWLRYAASTDLHTALLHALELSQEHQVKGWAEQEILVPLDKTGLERFAQLESEDALNRRTVDIIYTRTMPSLHFEVRRFKDLALARAWAGRT